MRKRKSRDLAKESRWRKHVAEQRRSGETVRQYCQQNALSESSFWFWKRELARRAREKGAGLKDGHIKRRSSDGSQPRRDRAVSSLIPVKIDSAWSLPIEISLPGGTTVRVAAGCDVSTLRTVLAALETVRC